MKRFITAILSVALLLCCAAYAESPVTLDVGPYSYDVEAGAEFDYDMGKQLAMIDHGDRVIMIQYHNADSGSAPGNVLAAMGKEFEDSALIASMLLELLYPADSENAIVDWYQEEPAAEGYSLECVMYNGRLTAEYGGGAIAGAAFAAAGGLLTFECVCFDAEVPYQEIIAERDAKLKNLYFVGIPVVEGQPSSSTVKTMLQRLMGAGSAREPLVLGEYEFDSSACDSATLEGCTLYASVGQATVKMEYAAFGDIGIELRDLCPAETEPDCNTAAAVLYSNTSYATDERYAGCSPEPDCNVPGGILFSGSIAGQYGDIGAAGAIIVTPEGILMLDCLVPEEGANVAATDIRNDILRRLCRDGAPVLSGAACPVID